MTMTLAPLPNLKQILAAREKEEGKRKAEAERFEAEQRAQRDLERIPTTIPTALPEGGDEAEAAAEDESAEYVPVLFVGPAALR